MFTTMSVQLPTNTLLDLVAQLKRRSFARTTRNAWEDLYVRRPGDKQFKLATVLRKEMALPS